jgi:hypothetical protein
MADKVYRFEFAVTGIPSDGTIPTTPSQEIPTGIGGASSKASAPQSGFQQALASGGKRLVNAVAMEALAPLNQATGGLASQGVMAGVAVYNAAFKGASWGAVGDSAIGIAITAIQFAINKIQERIAQNEAKAAELNEKDNLLIKAGTKSTPTFYNGSFRGVNSTDRA